MTNSVLASIKKRGRRSLLDPNTRSITTTLGESSSPLPITFHFSFLVLLIFFVDIDKVLEDDNHPIWRKLILNKHVLASMSDLSRTVTGSDEINAARSKCVEKLLNIGCFLNGDEFLNGREKAILKNSPEDPQLISALNQYGIDMDEYKQSFNNHSPFGYQDGAPVPAVLSIDTNKNKFTPIFVDKIQSDPFFSIYLRIDPEHVVKSSSMKRKTTSSCGKYIDDPSLFMLSYVLEIDMFREKKQRKTHYMKGNAERITQEPVSLSLQATENKKTPRTRRTTSNR